jgi:hypothetical protein
MTDSTPTTPAQPAPVYSWPTPDHSDPKWLTANGVRVVDGLRVWDYDLKSGTVDFAKTFGDHFQPGVSYWDGWFYVLVDGDGRHSLMNGDRMTTVHPFTRQPPPDQPAPTTTAASEGP